MPIFLAGLLAAQPSTPAPASCLHYGDPPVTLSGTVRLRTFYGPPGYGENPRTDSRETQYILFLPTSVCVDASADTGEEAEEKQLQVTLVPLGDIALNRYVGEAVEVRGTLFHAHTGHHNTPVLIAFQSADDIHAQ